MSILGQTQARSKTRRLALANALLHNALQANDAAPAAAARGRGVARRGLPRCGGGCRARRARRGDRAPAPRDRRRRPRARGRRRGTRGANCTQGLGR